MSRVNSKIITGTHTAHFASVTGVLETHKLYSTWCLRDIQGRTLHLPFDLDNVLSISGPEGDDLIGFVDSVDEMSTDQRIEALTRI